MLNTSELTFLGGVVALPDELVGQFAVARAQSTMANFSDGLAAAAVPVAPAIRNPTVTMIPHFWPTNAEMFGA